MSTQSTPATTTEQADSGLETITLGEPFAWTQCGDDASCDIEVVFTDATLTETCPHGVSYPDMESMDEPGAQYLTLAGEYHVRANEWQGNFSIAETDFTAVDEEGYASNSLIAYDCEAPSVDERLSNPVDIGLKRKGELTLAIPKGTQELRYGLYWSPKTYVLDISDLPVEPGSGERPLAPSPEASTTSTTAATATTSAEVAENVDYPAQADMTRLGARAETVVPFQDNQGRYWLCDQSNPTGEGNEYFYTNPNGCDGPYATQDELIAATFGDIGGGETIDPTPQPRAEQDIADGIARDLGCEGAVLNETTGAFEYFGCQ